MTFKNGKFYSKSGDVVPMEHGNKEQITILNRIDALHEYVIYIPQKCFPCICGATWYKEFNEGETIKCECGLVYGFILYDHVPCIKLLKNKPKKSNEKK